MYIYYNKKLRVCIKWSQPTFINKLNTSQSRDQINIAVYYLIWGGLVVLRVVRREDFVAVLDPDPPVGQSDQEDLNR